MADALKGAGLDNQTILVHYHGLGTFSAVFFWQGAVMFGRACPPPARFGEAGFASRRGMRFIGTLNRVKGMKALLPRNSGDAFHTFPEFHSFHRLGIPFIDPQGGRK